jgi:hypothetical protein
LDIGFIDHLYTKLGTASKYSAIVNLHNLQITTAHAKSFPRSSPLRMATPYKLNLFFKASLTELTRLSQVSSLQPLFTDRVENTVSKSASIVACVSVAAGTCVRSRCLETNVVPKLLASYSCFSGSTILALNKYATIYYYFRTRKSSNNLWKVMKNVQKIKMKI